MIAPTGCRITELEFDVAASAGWYSAIAGVLAGFALLAILLPLDHDAAEDDPEQREARLGRGRDPGVHVLLVADLVVHLCHLGGQIGGNSGEPRWRPIEQLINGVALGLTTLLLLFALRSILASYGANRAVFLPAQQIILGGTALFGPVVLLSLPVRQRRRRGATPARSRCGELPGPPARRRECWIDLAITMAALVAIALLALNRNRLPAAHQGSHVDRQGCSGLQRRGGCLVVDRRASAVGRRGGRGHHRTRRRRGLCARHRPRRSGVLVGRR